MPELALASVIYCLQELQRREPRFLLEPDAHLPESFEEVTETSHLALQRLDPDAPTLEEFRQHVLAEARTFADSFESP